MRGVIHPLPSTPSWRDVQFKKKSTGTNLPLFYANRLLLLVVVVSFREELVIKVQVLYMLNLSDIKSKVFHRSHVCNR
jgi:hypothetical protein